MRSRNEDHESTPRRLLKAFAIAAAGSALMLVTFATLAMHALRDAGQEPTPWVSVHHRASGPYEVAVSTRAGTLHLCVLGA